MPRAARGRCFVRETKKDDRLNYGAQRGRIGLLTSFGSRLGGGVFEAVVTHAHLLRSLGWAPTVIALRDRHSADDCTRLGDTPVVLTDPVGPAGVGYAPQLVRALEGVEPDVLHLHGIWQYSSHAGARWAVTTGRPYVISPHGMLDPWITGRGRHKKAIARLLYERRSWTRANLFHALTDDERSDILANTGKAHTAVIPNAVPPSDSARATPGQDHVFISRIHPKKNLDGLVDGWRLARERNGRPEARLIIAGWGDAGDVTRFEARLAELDDPSVSFVGPVFGAAKAKLLRDARFVCLPSFSEGLPMTMLEAWAEGTPTLMSAACHLDCGFEAGAALDCGTDASGVAEAFTQSFTMCNLEWATMSAAASMLARERFAPDVIAKAWDKLYAGLIAQTGAQAR